MSSGMPDWYVFKKPFILNRENIQAFLGFHPSFAGKYVFDREKGKLALSPGEDARHRKIALSALGKAENKTMFGGYVIFEKSGKKIRFELDGDSGYFGKPSEEDLKMAAEHISGLLQSIGFSPVIKLEDSSIVVEG
jgi:hypothetical protein